MTPFILGSIKNKLIPDLSLVFPDVLAAKIIRSQEWPSKTNVLRGDTGKARKIFNYKTQTKLKDLIKIMMDHELKKYNG